MLCTPQATFDDRLTATSDPEYLMGAEDEKSDSDEKEDGPDETKPRGSHLWENPGGRKHRIRSVGDPSWRDRYAPNIHHRLKAFSQNIAGCASTWKWEDMRIDCTGSTTTGKHVDYIFTVYHTDAVWRIYRRFSEFVKLHKGLRVKRPKRPKKTFFKASSKTVKGRQIALTKYLNGMIKDHQKAIFHKRGFVQFLTNDMDLMFEYIVPKCRVKNVSGRYLYLRSEPDSEGVPRAVYQNKEHLKTLIKWDKKYGWCCRRRRKVLLIAESNYADGQYPPGGNWDNPSGGPRERPYNVQKILPDKRITEHLVKKNLIKQMNARLAGLKVRTRFGSGIIRNLRSDDIIVVKLGYGVGFLSRDVVEIPQELTPSGKLKLDMVPSPVSRKSGRRSGPKGTPFLPILDTKSVGSDSDERRPVYSLQWTM